MKRALVLILGILLIGSACALSTNIEDSYSRGENIIVEVSGNILEPIFPEDVEFRRGHVRVPVEFDIKRLGEKYYIWAIAPNPEEDTNYTLVIEDVVATAEGRVDEIDYEKDFLVSGDLVSYTINPGFVFAKSDFEVEIFLNEDFNKEIAIEEQTVTLKPGKNFIEFSVNDFEGAQLNIISIGDYDMPAYVIGTKPKGTGTKIDVNVSNITVIDSEKEDAEEVVQYYCSELSGEICSASEICAGETVNSLDGNCCVGECNAPVEEDDEDNVSWGIIILLAVALAVLFIWYRYRKAGRARDPLKKRVEDAEKKISGLP